MRRATFATVTLLACALGAPRRAHASPQDLFGFGPRCSAMGGLGATFVDDYSAVHANPAGLSRARQGGLTLGYAGVAHDLWTARGTAAAQHLPVDVARGTFIGATLPLPLGGPLRDRVALGIGLYTPTDVVVRARITRPETPQFVTLADRAQSVAVQGGLGVDVGRGVRVGVGFAALAAVRGTVLIATDSTGRASSRVDNQLVASYAPVLGASWDIGPLRVGVVYRGVLAGRVAVQIDTQDIGITLPRLNIAGTAQYDPWQLAFEAAYAQGPWLAALGVTFKRWSEYAGPLEATTMNSPPPPAMNFGDTVVLRAGVEHRFTWRNAAHAAVRGGYFYEPTPVPEATGPANYLDTDRHAFTLGFAMDGRVQGSTLGLELFGQLHWLPTRVSTKSPEVAADNPGAPSLTYGGTLLVVGLSTTVTF